MSDNEHSKNDQLDNTEAEEGVELSAEELDKVITEKDPDFLTQLQNIGPIDPSALDDQIDSITAIPNYEEEKLNWEHGKKWQQVLFKILPFIVLITFLPKRINFTLKDQMQVFKGRLIYISKNFFPIAKSVSQLLLKKIQGFFQEINSTLRSYSPAKKVGLIFFLIFVGITIFLTIRVLNKKGFLPAEKELFISSMEEWSQGKYFFDPKMEQEFFFDSTRVAQNIMFMTKITANIRPSEGSGENPMLAVEFYIEGMSPEVLVEIKDREAEIRHLFLRRIEDMKFDELDSKEGKELLCDRLRKELNQLLTRGRIRKVTFKNFVLKA